MHFTVYFIRSIYPVLSKDSFEQKIVFDHQSLSYLLLNDFSGTTGRIGLVTGDAAALKHVYRFMTEKTFEFPVPKDMAIQNGDRHKQVNT